MFFQFLKASFDDDGNSFLLGAKKMIPGIPGRKRLFDGKDMRCLWMFGGRIIADSAPGLPVRSLAKFQATALLMPPDS